ncbi:MAG: inosine/xanthosine triphosphatase [archaeon]
MKPTKRKTVVAIGTKNPVKISAVTCAFRKVFPGKGFEFSPVSVSSGITPQPVGLQAFLGARNRSLAAVKALKADYGVGVEGGLRNCGKNGFFAEGIVAVTDDKRRISFGTAGGPKLPEKFHKLMVSKKITMGAAADRLFGTRNVNHGIGTTGLLTGGFFTRKDSFYFACIIALASRNVLSKLGDFS